MKIVVLGALGHIGSSLIREIPLLIDTSEIILVDNFRTQRYCSLFDLDQQQSYQFYNRDIASDDIEDITKNCDIIINLAEKFKNLIIILFFNKNLTFFRH